MGICILRRRSFALILLGLLLLGLPGLAWGQQPARVRPIVVLLGAPGAGKTTQAQFLKRKYGIPAISMSDLLKHEVGRRSSFGKKLKEALESGTLVNDQMMNDLVLLRLERKDTEAGFVLDGYPMNAAQAQFLDNLAKERGFPAPLIIELRVSDTVATQRLERRGRADDKPRIIEQRISEYHQDIGALLDHWKNQNLHAIDGTQKPDAVSEQIDKLVAGLGR
jgi:adenylate kinase